MTYITILVPPALKLNSEYLLTINVYVHKDIMRYKIKIVVKVFFFLIEECHLSCLDCNNQGSCLTCDILVFRTFIKDWCYCIQGYGESLTLSGICECIFLINLVCHPSCETCIKA